MSATITSATRVHSAINFIENLSVNENVYMFAGKIDPWDDENSPDITNPNSEEYRSIKASNAYMKKINASDGILALRRYDWSTGIIWTPWENDTDMGNPNNWLSPVQPFYTFVVDTSSGTTKYNVYMCLDNYSGSVSTIEPTGQNTDAFTLSDGYTWKFMYDVPDDYRTSIDTAFVPCPHRDEDKTAKQLEVETEVSNGTINRIRIDNAGSGYTVSGTSIIITGDGSNCTASFTVDGSGSITNIIVSNPGSGYSYATVILSGDGTNAEAKAIVSPINGHGYDSAYQLVASFALINQGFIHDEGGLFPAQNSYRRIGMIKNIRDTSGVVISSDAFNLFHEIQVSNVTGAFPYAQRIVGTSSGASALIFYIDPPGATSNASFFVIDKLGEFSIGETVELEGNPSLLAIVGNINNNTIDTLSGDIIYYENIQFVTRKTGQTEIFSFTIEF